jgi:hypothetical protein
LGAHVDDEPGVELANCPAPDVIEHCPVNTDQGAGHDPGPDLVSIRQQSPTGLAPFGDVRAFVFDCAARPASFFAF